MAVNESPDKFRDRQGWKKTTLGQCGTESGHCTIKCCYNCDPSAHEPLLNGENSA